MAERYFAACGGQTHLGTELVRPAAHDGLRHLPVFTRRATYVGRLGARSRCPPGAAGLPLERPLTTAAPHLANFENRMPEDLKEAGWERYRALKSYSDPGWQTETRASLIP